MSNQAFQTFIIYQKKELQFSPFLKNDTSFFI